MKLLAIDSSILNKSSVSRQLTRSFISQWQQLYPETQVTYRDLHAQPINHLSQTILSAYNSDPAQISPVIKEELELSGQLISEFLNAEVLVIGAPMYNFSVPSQLKTWIDRVLVAGKTFKYVDGKVQGLASGKQVFIISSRGGYYNAEPMLSLDHQERYLTTVLNFVGITDIHFIRAEGVNIGEQIRIQALQHAETRIRQLLELQVA
ncbi:FMN-dependent NADH-azoreductase [Legionella bononiensis]|uniref:FMN dependent NADH:quinone oxidoreductase n=1 Tax=Legionella bononiensis TaxID=2793102 RepID=A0ABS1WF79_9GAMM|nr:NAD(P)H-dependent oxidoreductase [Legionella bononiensis]MBL7479265.1 NAD(P)H-dependent oxidoreductase [Legionella bononiensis]MBL7528007.1 NAD(P)H-dependent oxidoreductase [Legionella bononiensis]MBL7563916.1 NAD(P)H-dependent oxidoreductase [Legionella bononiensis]